MCARADLLTLANTRYPELRFDTILKLESLDSWIITSSWNADIAVATDGYMCNLLTVVARS